jgi:hypothetical protein
MTGREEAVSVIKYLEEYSEGEDQFLPVPFSDRPVFKRGHGSVTTEEYLEGYLGENVPAVVVRDFSVLTERDVEVLEEEYDHATGILDEEGEVTAIVYGEIEDGGDLIDDRPLYEEEELGDSLTL